MRTNKLSMNAKRFVVCGKLITLALLFGAGVVPLHAQEVPSRTVEQVYQFDERGDAQIDWRFQLNAQSWAQWKASYGDHPDLLLREVKQQLAAAVIDDYKLEKDDMHRSAISKFSARALASYRGDGQFQIPVPKTLTLASGSGSDWVFTSSQIEPGRGILNVTYHAKLPAKARDAHVARGNDYNQLVYSLDRSPAKPAMLLYVGIACLFGAVISGAISMVSARKSPPSPPLPVQAAGQ
jgi:hypothetical protein